MTGKPGTILQRLPLAMVPVAEAVRGCRRRREAAPPRKFLEIPQEGPRDAIVPVLR